MNYFEMKKEEAQKRLEDELSKSSEPEPRLDGVIYDEDAFDPWSLFPSLYGNYSDEFDRCALNVLQEVYDREKRREDLAAEMFREMLCTGGFCDYGTSPRVCFWSLDEELLRRLIMRWQEYYHIKWGY